MAKVTVNAIDTLAQGSRLGTRHTKDIIPMIEFDLLMGMYRFDLSEYNNQPERKKFHADLNKKIESAFKTLTGQEFEEDTAASYKAVVKCLLGPPGQGKTASFQVAGKNIAKRFGLNYIEHVDDSYQPKMNDFIFVSQECAGENSSLTWGGLPKAVERKDVDGNVSNVVVKALNYRFTVFKDVAGGVLLLDDAANAATVVQNALLPVVQFGTFQGLKLPDHCIVGMTGNLGSVDGTYTTEFSTALKTRIVSFFVQDTPKDFVERANKKYNDGLGTLGVTSFIEKHPQLFAELPDPQSKGGFACSRSWENFIDQARSIVLRNGGRGHGEYASLIEISESAMSILGPKVGHEVSSYYQALLTSADPLAKEIMSIPYFDAKTNVMDVKNAEKSKENKAQIEAISEKVMAKRTSQSSDVLNFQYQFSSSISDYNYVTLLRGISKIDKDLPESKREEEIKKVFIESTARFTQALVLIDEAQRNFAISHFKTRLLSSDKLGKIINTSAGDKREFHIEYKTLMAHVINSTNGGKLTGSEIKSIVAALTDADKVGGFNKRPSGP